MKPFLAPVDDILFSLDHIAGAARLPDWDTHFGGEIARHFAAFAEGEIAPLDEPGDRQGCVLNDGRVAMPDGFGAVYQAYCAQGWPGLTAPEQFGGQGMGAVMLAVTSEIFSGACHSLQMVTGLVPGAIRTVMRFGSDAQKAALIPALASGELLATMCLTEPGAGSDLSRIRCRAVQDGDAWRITGEKIFISGGDQDMSDGILHLVLARTSDDALRGLSLFLCRDTVNGARNPVTVTRIEEKMGLHASPTCQLVFDGAVAELIGAPGEGLKGMFTMMNHARLDVALQGVAHAARAHDVAASYAAERVQGRGADGTPVALDQHADVARMLDEIDSLALVGRAMTHLALVTMEAGDNPDLVEFLTPVAKVFCTEAGMRAADLGMQVLGGYGYLGEYRLEQTYRDARITAIYEGANGIHARALAERLLRVGNGRTADAFEAFLTAQVEESSREMPDEKRGEALSASVAVWRQARAIVVAAATPSALADDFMQLTAAVLGQAIWARFVAAAKHNSDPARITRLAKHQQRLLLVRAKARFELIAGA